uniref:Ig-like domain-containing protein n=1 Tax=Astyanax mexicanus TaxID=7994 RepID=A0A8B9KZ54_ASTMX
MNIKHGDSVMVWGCWTTCCVSTVTLVPSGNPVRVGENVTFSVNPLIAIVAGTWQFENNILVFWYPGDIMVGNGYEGRVSFNQTSLQLSLHSLQTNDSGVYILQSVKPSVQAQVSLSVQGEFTHTHTHTRSLVILSCEVTGPVDSVYWMKDGVILFSNNKTSFSNQNKTLSISQLALSDDGNYQCVATNIVSNMTSVTYHLTVNYGPWNVTISGPAIAQTGDRVRLNCSALSQPPSDYSWYYNGTKVAEGAVYETASLTLNRSEEYVCTAHNNITGINSSATWNLTVIGNLLEKIYIHLLAIALTFLDGEFFIYKFFLTIRSQCCAECSTPARKSTPSRERTHARLLGFNVT